MPGLLQVTQRAVNALGDPGVAAAPEMLLGDPDAEPDRGSCPIDGAGAIAECPAIELRRRQEGVIHGARKNSRRVEDGAQRRDAFRRPAIHRRLVADVAGEACGDSHRASGVRAQGEDRGAFAERNAGS